MSLFDDPSWQISLILNRFNPLFLRCASAAYGLAIVFLLCAVGIATHFAMRVMYGIPAPLATPQAPDLSAQATPNWLAGTQAEPLSQWRLIGVVAQGSGAQGLALLQSASSSRAVVYRVGQQLPDGAVLTAVDTKAATITMNGAAQTLVLEQSTDSTAAAMNPISTPSAITAIAPPAPATLGAIPSAAGVQAQFPAGSAAAISARNAIKMRGAPKTTPSPMPSPENSQAVTAAQ